MVSQLSSETALEGGVATARACPVCGCEDSRFRFHAAADRLGPNPPPDRRYSYFECADCASVFIGQLPRGDELTYYYESDGYHRTTSPSSSETLLARLLTTLRRFHLHLSRPLPKVSGHALLDFGCGGGDYLEYARWRGWRGIGAEFSDRTAAPARRRGFKVKLEEEIEDLADESFTVISLIHSLEHHPQPGALLRLLASKLAGDGRLFIELPSLDCHEFQLFGSNYSMIQAPVHLQFLSDSTVEYLAHQCGLELVSVRNNHWSPIYYVWSLLNFIEDSIGVRTSRGTKNLLSTIGFPITMWLSRLMSRSRPGAVRQYTLARPA